MINEIRLANFSLVEHLIHDDSVDLILTDPPYAKKYFHTYEYLAEYAPRIMKHGASLVTIAPHYSLPAIINVFSDRLKYRWVMCMNQFDGRHARMAMGIEILWKPILWYVKGSYPQGRGFIADGFKVEETKRDHIWQQDEVWAEFFISKLTKEGDTVLDPYVGSGTVAAVAKRLKRNFIAFDIDSDAVETARQRVGSTNVLLISP